MSDSPGVRKLTVDLDLLRKYNRPGRRPGSSRTAPHFHSGFGPAEFRREIIATNAADDAPDLSLYFHFPFCRSLCSYCGCTVVVTRETGRIDNYLDDMKKEIDLLAGLIRPDRKTVQVQWGGGTPTYLSPEQIRDIFGHIRGRFTFADNAEIGIEIDPRRLSPDHLSTLRDIGFNHVCFGVQDLDPQVQKTVNRVQPEALTRQVIEESRSLGFDSISVDLIYGLPYQSVRSFSKTLHKIIDISPDRLAIFGYGHIPRLKEHQCILEKYPMPDLDERLEMLKTIIETLTGAGYVYIGMDHFAKPDDELARALEDRTLYRNLQGYGTRAGTDLHGIGLTSISQLQNVFAQNTKSTSDYNEAVELGRMPTAFGCRLDEDDKLRGHVVRELICNHRIDKVSIEDRFGVDFDSYFSDSIDRLDEFVADDLIQLSTDRIEVSDTGRPLIRNIATVFCRRL
jgi:oxygen-independent coproporphyrinogen-3 oxidase